MFWTKKKEQDANRKMTIETTKENLIKTSNLRITFTDSNQLIWTLESDKLLAPWLSFKKWFHYRNQSKFFTMKYDIGETTIKRSTIKYYEIFFGER